MNDEEKIVLQLIEDFKNPIKLDSPDWISEAIIALSTVNYKVGVAMAQAELNEQSEVVKLLAMRPSEDAKKMTVSEAEKRAVVETNNQYGVYKNMSAGIVEIMNAMKKRLEVLGWELKQG